MAPSEDEFELAPEDRDALCHDAVEMIAQNPELKPVGLVVLHDAPEARGLRRAVEEATGQSLGERSFLGVVPRDFVLEILRTHAAQGLDWLVDSPTNSDTAGATLPIVVAGVKGLKVGAIPFPG